MQGFEKGRRGTRGVGGRHFGDLDQRGILRCLGSETPGISYSPGDVGSRTQRS